MSTARKTKATAVIEPTDEVEVTPEENTTPTHTTAELAALFNTDTKTLRRFLRSNLEPSSLPGKGGRYNIPTDSLEALKTRFNAKGSRGVTKVAFKDEAPAEG